MRKLFNPLSLLLTVLGLFFPAELKAQLAQQTTGEQVVTYSGSTAFVLTQSPVNPNLLSTGTGTFIMNVNPATNAARVYITNDTANACNNLTLSIASTGNTALNSFNQNLNAWQTITVQTGIGSFVSSQPLTLPANGTVAVTSQPIIGTKIALFIVLSAGCATTTIDVQVVFGTFSPPVSAVQGIAQAGASVTGVNPLTIGGKDINGLNQFYSVSLPADAGGNVYNGFPIGGFETSVANGNMGTQVVFPKGSSKGGFGVIPWATVNAGTMNPFYGSRGTNAATSNQPGLLQTPAGFHQETGPVGFTTTGQNQSFLAQTDGAYNSCYVTMLVTNVGGTTPTLDGYYQTSNDNVNFTDRIHFAQVTTGTVNQYAGIASSTGITPAVMQDRALAVSTKVDGPMGKYSRFIFVITGTTPNYNVTMAVTCN